MIDVLAMPAVANDIRLSTLEPVQQFGSRIAHILSGELSRLRADSAFALAAGVTLQTVAADGDRIRAEQLSTIDQRLVSLDTQAVGSGRASSEDRDRGALQPGPDHPAASDTDDLEALLMALSRALHSLKAELEQEGVSGHPLVCVLPLDRFLPAQAGIGAEFVATPAHDGDSGDAGADLHGARGLAWLILCLGFDGDLGQTRQVWGFAYREDRLLAQLHGSWASESELADMTPEVHERHWLADVSDVYQDVSVLQCRQAQRRCDGHRVRLAAGAGEPDRWAWQEARWTSA